MTEEKTIEYWICPKEHYVPLLPDNYAKVLSDDVDADGRPMTEDALWCYGCNKAYGISEYKTPEE